MSIEQCSFPHCTLGTAGLDFAQHSCYVHLGRQDRKRKEESHETEILCGGKQPISLIVFFLFVYRLTSTICIHSRGLDGRDGMRLGWSWMGCFRLDSMDMLIMVLVWIGTYG